ncbi:DUF4376 domain-containing protein [Kaistia dalseonensis]|uniref:DUF4376 domain-containing protein n=1 Tax=Kaistia dalseonensis TaxID=410840 RepID=A0ABU0H6M5_9HYPH|nr:DUF4376 domain-containing protein [Kaistia dalseonensis]MCX5495355.1 DUF4376 domain-containing protein [Kaistia dalseonensis]MDQ0437941.1 hypothetical protein [Kaistia dalseonensis]
MQFARIQSGAVVEIIPDIGVPIVERFSAAIVETLIECGDDVAEGWSYDGGSFAAPTAPVPSTSELKAYAAAKRWQVETGGVMVDGVDIRTDEKSQNRVSGAALLAISDPDLATIDWEAQPGVWIEVPAATMKAIGIAVGRHVQACFSALKVVQADIDAGTITTIAEIDAAAWPS